MLLKTGIEINNLQTQKVNISKIFIKLNKKLDLDITNIKIISNDDNKSIDLKSIKNEILSYSKELGLLNLFINKITLKNLIVGNEKLGLIYQNNNLELNSSYADINASIKPYDKGILFDIKNLVSNKFKLSANANINVNLTDLNISADGNLSVKNIFSKFKINYKDDLIKYSLFDTNSTDLKPVLEEFLPNSSNKKTLIDWIAIRTKSKLYKIYNFSGKISLKDKKFYYNDIVANGLIKDMRLNYNDKLAPSFIDDVNVSLKNDNLYLLVNNLTFKNQVIKNSKVVIKNLFGDKKVGIDIHIDTPSRLSKTLFEIPAAYGIKLPIEQISGRSNTKFNIFMNFSPFKIKFDGKFELKNADILIGGAKFYTSNATMFLDKNNKFIFKNTNFRLKNIFDADANGEINLNTKVGNLNTFIKFLKIDGVLDAKDIRSNLLLDFTKSGTILNLDAFDTKMILSNENKIEIPNISKVVPYSGILKDFGVKSGSVFINTKNFKNLDIECKNIYFNAGIKNLDNTPYNRDSFFIRVSPYEISGKSKSNKVSFFIRNNQTSVNVRNIDYVIDTQKFTKNSSTIQDKLNLKIEGTNSGVIVSDYNRSIGFSKFSGSLIGDDIKFNGNIGSGNVLLDISKNALKFDATNISSITLNSLIKRDSFDGGNFELRVIGQNFNNLKGEILIKNTFLKDYIFYQNILSFINSVPALLTFKNPDFTSKGFSIKNGKIYFTKQGNFLKFVGIQLNGTSANIAGKGYIDFYTKKIHIDLEIQLLKAASSFIDKIPLVNYIILGKNKTISTGIKIRGTLDKPTYSTQVLKGLLKTPFDIIKNTLSLPFVIFK